MPSVNVLEQKKQIVEELKAQISASCAGVVVDYKGISVGDDTKLRKELREANVNYNVVKNTLLSRALEDTALADLSEVLAGTTALATCEEDHVAAARILGNFADTSKTFSIKGGFLDGELIDLEKLSALAKLPTREVLLATVCNAFNAPIASFARAIQAIVDKGGESEEAAPAEA